jgi:hypothetical protein
MRQIKMKNILLICDRRNIKVKKFKIEKFLSYSIQVIEES